MQLFFISAICSPKDSNIELTDWQIRDFKYYPTEGGACLKMANGKSNFIEVLKQCNNYGIAYPRTLEQLDDLKKVELLQ